MLCFVIKVIKSTQIYDANYLTAMAALCLYPQILSYFNRKESSSATDVLPAFPLFGIFSVKH